MENNTELSACEIQVPGAEWDFRVETSPRWVRVKFGGETIVDSKRAVLASESGRLPVYYFPQEDVRMDLLVPTEYQSVCSTKEQLPIGLLKSEKRFLKTLHGAI